MVEAPLLVNTDFLHHQETKAAAPLSFDPMSPQRFLNRELSWLEFNRRVLEAAQNPDVPLMERVRLLSISGSNLDEFYTVRVAGLRELMLEGIRTPAADGATPQEQLEMIDHRVRALMQDQQALWRHLQELLRDDAGVELIAPKQLQEVDRAYLRTKFIDHVLPVLSPLAVDPAHPFPFIPNTGITLALELPIAGRAGTRVALLPIPQQINRFMRLPDDADGRLRYILLEDVILEFISLIFTNQQPKNSCLFRVLRDSDIEIEEEAEDLVREFETALKRRRRGKVIRLGFNAAPPRKLMRIILEALHVTKEEIFKINGMLGIGDVSAIIPDEFDAHKWPGFTPRLPERIQDFEGDIFAAIKQKDLLLHHPYETFDTVIRFLTQAARDPDVLAIKQTLYRTSARSPIVAALCEAAEQGKSITALVELKARFDEAANIEQSRRLERAGAHVVYGFIDWKTHAKISTVVRREGEDLVTYTHFGTGNYHPITARIYTDVSLFTCNKQLGRDANKVFNYVSGYAEPEGLENLAISPTGLKPKLLALIEEEVAHAKAGRPAQIWAKMNALIEPDVIDALYSASQAGVKIDLVVRGICGLRPGILGFSENIRVKSIVGRFLEHARIICFGAGEGLPSPKAKVFISSADWMGRNLNRRIETLIEITNKTVHAQILSQIMAANLADQANSWVLQPDGSYLRHNIQQEAPLFNAHQFFLDNPSLSGRGSAAVRDLSPETEGILGRRSS